MPRQFAAVDLGSNSFHMLVAVPDPAGGFSVVDKLKEPVRLAAGLDEGGAITPEAAVRALACLARFAERLAEIDPRQVRAVGTNTLRKATNRHDFIELAQETLGHEIEIISGAEEARLIYAGVHQVTDLGGRRLVIDIGGGSTEVILGEGESPRRLSSLHMGCVTWSQRFFPRGKLRRKQLELAITAARQQIGGVMRSYREEGWDHVLGSSGTIKAIEATLMLSGQSSGGVSREALEALAERMVRHKSISDVELPGVPDHRRPVLPGGVAVLLALFRSLHIEQLTWVPGALKEGLLLQVMGRAEQQADVRDASVRLLAERLQVDQAHAERVRTTALELLAQVADAWQLTDPLHARLLGWAADLHEAGQFLSHSGYHKHSAYILASADLPGFSRQEQGALAAIAVSQRGRLSWERIRSYAPGADSSVLRLAMLLRLAVAIHRTRSRTPAIPIHASATPDGLLLRYPRSWLRERPLTLADLDDQAETFKKIGYTLLYT